MHRQAGNPIFIASCVTLHKAPGLYPLQPGFSWRDRGREEKRERKQVRGEMSCFQCHTNAISGTFSSPEFPLRAPTDEWCAAMGKQ